MRRLYWLLVIVAILLGAPYAALILNRAMGAWDATAVEHDGSITYMRFDPDMPPPQFLPIYPGSHVVEASFLVSKQAPSGVGRIELAAQGSLDAVRSFYRSRLKADGFEVSDVGTPGLNAATAAYLGVDDVLVAKRTATDDYVYVQIGIEEGTIVRSRLLDLRWRKISETPGETAARD
ncbi:MAG TPA: hypothetical protein VMU06_21465 [Stellaceae bacterium]|nr:hypothetical protein [Stellaceae bacterium]